MTETLTQSQAAEVAGLTTRRLQQLDKDGSGPPRMSGGGYFAADLGRWLKDRLLSELGVANDGKADDYEAERARLTKAQADKTELEVAELRAELVRAPVLEHHWQNMVAAARAKLLSLPSKLAPQIAGPDQLTRVQDMLHAGVFEALAELAGDAFPDNIRVRVDKAASQPHDLGMEATTEADSDPVGKRAPATQRGGQRGAGPVPKRKGAVPKRSARRAE